MFARILIFISLVFLFLLPSEISAQVVVNEFAPNASEEWVEFHNASESAEFLKEYWIDDKADGGQAKKQLTTLNIDNPKFPYFILGSNFLNNDGDSVILYDNQGNVVSQYQYSSVPSDGLTIGRHPDQTGELSFLVSASKGAPNASKKIDPTPAPTPSKTPSPTLSPSATPLATHAPTLKPSPSPKRTPSPTPSSEPTFEPEVLGKAIESLITASPSIEPARDNGNTSKLPLLAFLFIVPGVGLSLFGAFSFLKMRRTPYNDLSENSVLRPKN